MTILWRPRSIRMRLTLWYAGSLTVALLLFSGFVFGFLWRMLSFDLDRQLTQDIELTQRMLEPQGDHFIWNEGGNPDEEDEIPRVAVFDAAGKAVYASPRFKSIRLSEYRVMDRKMRIDQVGPLDIRAARTTKPMQRELRFLSLIFILGVPVAVTLAGAGGYSLARRALVPADRMASQARAISADRLGDRLPIENPDDEFGRLAQVFNEAFARLDESFSQLRRFTADASHELRTPLAALRSVGEVGLGGARDSHQYREIIGSMLEEVDRLTHLVDCLLQISRADGGQLRLQPERTDLAELAHAVVQQLSVLGDEKRLRFEVDAAAGPELIADPLVLRQALTNLIDNAIKYSHEGSAIRIAVREQAGRAILEVADSGPGIAAEHVGRIFERFYRIDRARSRSLGGTGLGLAITRWAVEAHGGDISVESRVGIGSTFRISIPITPAEPARDNQPESPADPVKLTRIGSSLDTNTVWERKPIR